jgi:O-methyltransferase
MIHLINNLIAEKVTMVEANRFYTILRNFENINKLNGDIVECGVWRGGMSIFLARLFSTKNIWMCDSFEGFQPLNIATYPYANEPHTPFYPDPIIRAPYEMTLSNLKRYGLENDPRIKILKGWVKDTLHPSRCEIKDIALLRVDVDAYSATREVLDFLYPKVVDGGYIIFDDSCLIQSAEAICDYFQQHQIKFDLLHTDTGQKINNPRAINPCGCYMIKKN